MIHAPATTRPELSTGAILRLSLAYALAINGMVLTPFIVAAVMRKFGLEESAATQIAGIEILGIAASCALFPRWISRGARSFSRLGLIGLILAQLASALAPTAAALSVARGVAGLFEGMLFVVVAASVAHRPSSDRTWGLINLAAGILDGSILVAISFLPASVLSHWIFMLLGALMLLSVPTLLHVGQFAEREQAVTRVVVNHNKAPWKLVLAVRIIAGLLYGIQASQWAVAGIVGTSIGLTDSSIGILLSLSSLLGFVGAAIPSRAGSRPYRLAIMLTSQLVMCAALIIFFGSHDPLWYFVSQVAINVSLFVIIPFLTGMLSDVDSDGSLVTRGIVFTFLGAGLGTALAGSGYSNFGSVRFAFGMCAGVVAAAPLIWYALRSANQLQAKTVRGA